MRWFKRNLWKVGIVLAGTLLLVVLMALVLVSAVAAHEGVSGAATPGTVTVQATPTAASTITAKTAQEQLINLQRDNDRSFQAWFWSSGATFLSTLAIALAGVLGFLRYLRDQRIERVKQREDRQTEREKREQEQQRWLKDQETEREKRAEERFQAAVEGLSSEREEARIGAAILLRTFLRPGYEQFYTQTFDLAVANLRLPRTPDPPENLNETFHPREDPNAPFPLTTLSQALIGVFKEAFPLARSQEKRGPQSLDASRILLDSSYLERADLKQAWMPRSFLRRANVRRADLSEARLWEADLSGVILWMANLSGADLWEANLSNAKLDAVNFSNASFVRACLAGASLSNTNLEEAFSLKDTDLRKVTGLTKEQLAACKAKGAIIDEAVV